MSDEKTLDFSRPEDVLKGFAIVDNNMRLLSAANVEMSKRISELEYQVEIFARMNEKLLVNTDDDTAIRKVSLEEYKQLASTCREEFLRELKNIQKKDVN
jgi:hypothetical protein